MNNPYFIYLNRFFQIIVDFQHSTNRIDKVLKKDVERYTAEGARYSSSTALVIGDWTGPTDNGWKLTFPTGAQKTTNKENYSLEIDNILSREFGFVFAQCFEAFETLLKDFVTVKIHNDLTYKESLSNSKNYSRESLKGGNEIFELIKKAGGKKFKEYSRNNNNNFKFSETFRVLSEVRHAVTHSQGILERDKIPEDKYYYALFEHLFQPNKLENKKIHLRFDIKTIKRLLIYWSEFGFQIFKILSEQDSFKWKI